MTGPRNLHFQQGRPMTLMQVAQKPPFGKCSSRSSHFLKKILFIYSRETQREREAETQAEGEAGSMQEPDVGLDPGSSGSCPGMKAALNR